MFWTNLNGVTLTSCTLFEVKTTTPIQFQAVPFDAGIAVNIAINLQNIVLSYDLMIFLYICKNTNKKTELSI